MTTAEATNTAVAVIQGLCKLQNLIDEGSPDQKQVGRDAMELVAEQFTSLGLTDEIISRAAWQLTRD